MPIPTNISGLLATDMGTLPYTNTQTVDFLGTTYTVWYKITAPVGGVLMGERFYGDAVIYRPTVDVYVDGFAGGDLLGTIGANLDSQTPLLAGRTYYYKVIPNGGNPTPAVLNIDMQAAQDLPVPAGSIFIRAASILPSFQGKGYTGLAAGYISATTGAILGFELQFQVGESGDYLPDTGELLFGDEYNGLNEVILYNSDLTVIAAIAGAWTTGGFPVIRTHRDTKKFYVGSKGQFPTPCQYVTINQVGGVSVAVSLTGAFGMTALAANVAETFVYMGIGVPTSQPVSKWSVAGGAFVADFAVGIVGSYIFDILVMNDDSVIVGFFNPVTDVVIVKRYDASGAILNTYTPVVGAQTTTSPRLGYANDDSLTYWVFMHLTTGFSDFRQVGINGVEILQITAPDAIYLSIETPTPLYRFVTSDSCPFVLFIGTAAPTFGGIYELVPGKRNDTIYTQIAPTPTSVDVEIPEPSVRIALLGL